MKRLSKFSLTTLAIVLCVPLGACGGSAADEPQLPPVTYEVTQRAQDGITVIFTDLATKYYINNEGRCVMYTNPDDPKNADYRTLCGGYIQVKPKTAH